MPMPNDISNNGPSLHNSINIGWVVICDDNPNRGKIGN